MKYDLNDPLLTTYPSRWSWLQVATGISTIGIKVPNHNLKLLFLSLLSLMCMFQDKRFWISKKNR